jgi:hypothetical protein
MRELYRQAFAELSENPLNGEFLKAADMNGFVNATREITPLDQINEELWQLREKLIRVSRGRLRKMRAKPEKDFRF